MKKKLLLLLVLLVTGASLQAAELRVVDGTITTAIEDQMPVDRLDSYRADYGKLFCFTRVVGAEGSSAVTHVWVYEGEEMARVTLPVLSQDWRTYSSKRFLPQWVGEWSVLVLDEQGRQIAEYPFRLE
ncbi:MAG: DUF2914 domain-containing protein [Pelovirga sp.]